MTNTTHTPGPWEVSQWTPAYDDIGGDYSVGYKDADGHYWDIVTLEPSRASRLADARLIAAAPELLAALIELQQMVEAGENNEGTHEVVRAAIAKAKGE